MRLTMAGKRSLPRWGLVQEQDIGGRRRRRRIPPAPCGSAGRGSGSSACRRKRCRRRLRRSAGWNRRRARRPTRKAPHRGSVPPPACPVPGRAAGSPGAPAAGRRKARPARCRPPPAGVRAFRGPERRAWIGQVGRRHDRRGFPPAQERAPRFSPSRPRYRPDGSPLFCARPRPGERSGTRAVRRQRRRAGRGRLASARSGVVVERQLDLIEAQHGP